MATSIGRLNVIVGANADPMRRELGGLGSVFGGVRSMLLGGAGLVGGVYALRGALSDVADFNKRFTKSLAIMGDVSDDLRERMRAATIEVERLTEFDASQAADAYFYLASAGMSATQALAAMPRVAQFAQAGNFDLATATDLVTDAQSALGMTVDDTAQNLENLTAVSDALVKANTLANASVEQFSQALTTKAASASRILGKDIEETLAVLSAFADQGTKGQEAGTQFAIVLRDLQTKALENAEAFKQHGVAVFDSMGEMRHMSDILADLEGALDGMSDATKKATLLGLGFSDKSVAALQALIGLSDQVREYDTNLRDAAGTTEDIANRGMTPLAKATNALSANFTAITQNVGPPVLDFFTGLAETVNLASEYWTNQADGVGRLKDEMKELGEVQRQLDKQKIDIDKSFAPWDFVAVARSAQREMDRAAKESIDVGGRATLVDKYFALFDEMEEAATGSVAITERRIDEALALSDELLAKGIINTQQFAELEAAIKKAVSASQKMQDERQEELNDMFGSGDDGASVAGDLERRAESLRRAIESPEEAFQRTMAGYRELLDEGAITAEEFERAWKQASERVRDALDIEHELQGFADSLTSGLQTAAEAIAEESATIKEAYEAGLIDRETFARANQGVLDQIAAEAERRVGATPGLAGADEVGSAAARDALLEAQQGIKRDKEVLQVQKDLLKEIKRLVQINEQARNQRPKKATFSP